MKYVLTIFLVVSTSFSGFSQEELIVEEVVHKEGYDYIPLEFMKDSPDGLVGFRDFDEVSGEGKSKKLEVYWNSSCTDGSYHMVITPEQIYLRSGHENPNPNRFYWLLPIDNTIYASIERTLKKNQGNLFGKKYDDSYVLKYNDEYVLKYKGEELEKKCDYLLKSRILKYFEAFNKSIAVNKLSYAKIIFPSKTPFYNISIERLERIIVKKKCT